MAAARDSAGPAGSYRAERGCMREHIEGAPGAIRSLVTGAGGFIGHHLVAHLKRRGHWVRGVDLRAPAFAPSVADEFLLLDLREAASAHAAVRGVDEVYALAADMGGIGYISSHHASVLRNNLLVDVHTLDAAVAAGVDRYVFTSSACVYPDYLQDEDEAMPLREEDVYPAQPEDAYGWGKLVVERLCRHYRDELGIATGVVRLHNVYGPLCTWRGGREKAPAALCRKVATAKLSGVREIEIWGDGRQTRSFCYVDDCVEGIHRMMRSGHAGPLNLGSERTVTIDRLADIVAEAAGVPVVKRHVPGPQGVRGRGCDSTRLAHTVGWRARVRLEEGIARTYRWVEEQVRAARAEEVPA